MFYVAAKDGFMVIKNTSKGQNKTVWVVDVREAKPFPTFDEADTEAKSRIQGYYAVLGISHIPLKKEE
jgi:hypothetical protein